MTRKHHKPIVIPPEGGWVARCMYLVDVAYNVSNPIHRALFYTGFLNDDGAPGSYNGVIQKLPHTHETGMDKTVQEIYYLKAIAMLASEKDFEPEQDVLVSELNLGGQTNAEGQG